MAANADNHEAKSALLIIDVQVSIATGKGICTGWPNILANIAELIVRARASDTPIFFIQHDGGSGHPLERGTEGWALCPELGVMPADTVVHKTAGDAFFETSLEAMLRERCVGSLIVAGCMTEYCVDTTVRRAISLGFDVSLAGDAHGTWNSSALAADKIIEHHNGLLDQFSAGRAEVTVMPSSSVVFS